MSDHTPAPIAAKSAPAPRLRMLISDVDGTLVTKDKQLTGLVVDAVKRLRAAGLAFALVSSRPPGGLKRMIEELQLTEPVAAFNGGCILDSTLCVISQPLMIDAEAARITVAAITDSGADCWLFTPDEWLVLGLDGAYVARETRTVGFGPRVVESFDPYLSNAAKIVGASGDFDALKACEASLQAQLAGTAAASRSQNYYLDVTHPDANKGHALRELARLAAVPISEVAAIGDMVNDLPMLSIAGLSIAMGNAPASLKQATHFVTGTNEDSGFATAVDQFVLPRIVPKSQRDKP